ncbi:hypothetical protein [Formosa sp. PL04]|uniref:hypothetical protein n=1 Tax=Formosa sp. PL04 TaxID=3081755 RepID=UPI002981FA78|nr:hypothetical protein [Formosa sp. PL04]MDW5291026.1 hypothetical protein [Formosa sp. PL04]
MNETTNIENVVFVLSVAAYNTNFTMPPEGKDLTDTFNKKDIPFIRKKSHPYARAKFIANQTVERFYS